MKMQKNDKGRVVKRTRAQEKEYQENMEKPVNKFLNARTEDGTLDYKSAKLMWDNVNSGAGPVLKVMRRVNAHLHELRWRKKQAEKYLEQHKSTEPITIRDKNGNIMDRDELYLSHISMGLNVYNSVTDIEKTLIENLLPLCDGKRFTFEQFEEYLFKVKKIVDDAGFELFPSKVELIEPQ